jgi:glycosyltransferase involved in cell wall biosynthesis
MRSNSSSTLQDGRKANIDPCETELAVLISVIIPVRNEERTIGSCLEALALQDYSKKFFEVLVVDNGSTDRTLSTVLSYADHLRVKVIEKPLATISALRNEGSAAASGDLLAFLDADCIPPRTWLSTAAAIFEANPYQIIGADYLIPERSSLTARTWFGNSKLRAPKVVTWIPAGDLIVSKALFCSIGRFDESLETNEDCELCIRSKKRGFPVFAHPELAVVHMGTPQTLGDFFQKQKWHGRSVFKVFRRNFPSLQNLYPVGFAFYVLLSILGILVGIAKGLVSHDFVPLIFAGSALLLVCLLLAIPTAFRNHRLGTVLVLTLMMLVFGLARAASLLDPRTW